MKSTTLALFICTLILPLNSIAQKDGNTRLSAGFALGRYGKFDHGNSFSNETNYPSFIIQVERPWIDQFTLGAYVGYSGQKHLLNNKIIGYAKHNYYRVGALVSYKLNEMLRTIEIDPGYDWDIYSTLRTGFSLENRDFKDYRYNSNIQPIIINDTDSRLLFDLGITVGCRYHILNDLSLFGELGYGTCGFVTVGACFWL